MRIAIVGAGAVGGVVAWHLARAGFDPLVVARPETASILNERGITLSEAEPGATAEPRASRTVRLRATENAAQAGPQDVVFVGFKAHDWLSGLSLVTPLIGPSTTVVPLLNGIPWWYLDGLGESFGDRRLESVDASGHISAAVPTAHVLGCVVYVGSNRTAPDQVIWNGRKRLILGEPAGSLSPRLGSVVGLLCESGIDAEPTADIRSGIWLKLLGNASFNPVSAITGATIDEMVDDPALRQVLRSLMLECIAVASSVGVTDLPDVEARLAVHPSMKGIKTSMLQDREAGRTLELGAIVDAVCELGRRTGVQTPMLASISALAAAVWRNAILKRG